MTVKVTLYGIAHDLVVVAEDSPVLDPIVGHEGGSTRELFVATLRRTLVRCTL